MKSFLTRVTVGEFSAEGEGNSKKLSKKRAAISILQDLKKLPLTPAVEKPKTHYKKRTKTILKVIKLQQHFYSAVTNYEENACVSSEAIVSRWQNNEYIQYLWKFGSLVSSSRLDQTMGRAWTLLAAWPRSSKPKRRRSLNTCCCLKGGCPGAASSSCRWRTLFILLLLFLFYRVFWI